MTFKTQVQAQYELVEVDAGLKDILKKAASALVGLAFSTNAYGLHFKNPQKMAKIVEQAAQESGNQGSDYKVKVTETHKGNVQFLKFQFVKDGKSVGQLTFSGTNIDKETDFNNLDYGLSKEGKEDSGISSASKTLYDYMADTIRDELFGTDSSKKEQPKEDPETEKMFKEHQDKFNSKVKEADRKFNDASKRANDVMNH